MRLVLDVPVLLGVPRLVQTRRLRRWQSEPPLKGAAPPAPSTTTATLLPAPSPEAHN